MKRLMIGLVVILFLTCFSGCEKGSKILGGGGTDEDFEKTFDIYTPMERVRTLNPFCSLDKDSYYFGKLVYEGLYYSDRKLETKRSLVESETFEDGAVTLKLKEGVKWHDGHILSAADVKFSISCYKEGNGLYKSMVDKIDTVRVIGNSSIRIKFKNDKDAALANLTFPILPKHIFKSVSAAVTAEEDFIPVGTGRYKVKSFDFVRGIVLDGFQDFHGGTVPQNRIHFRVIPSEYDAVNMMGIESMSLMFSENQDRESIFSNRDVRINDFCGNSFEAIGFNMKSPVTGNIDVRKAVAYSINPKEIIKKAYYGNGIMNKNIYYPGYLNTDSESPMFEKNINKAKKYLNKAGYHDIDKDGVMENAAKEKIRIMILVSQSNPTRAVAAGIISEQLKKSKIESVVENVSFNDFYSKLTAGDYDIFIGGYAIQENYDLRFLLHGDYNNPIFYNSNKVNGLLDDMQTCKSDESKKDDYIKLSTIIKQDIPYYCILYKTFGAVTSENMSDNISPTPFDHFRGSEKWFCLFPKKREE